MEHLTLASFKQKICECGLTDGASQWQYKGDVPCIIDFYADWCGPCKALAPVLEQVAKEFSGKVNIYKVNTEKEQDLAALFSIRSIPSLLFVPLKGEPQMSMGALPKHSLEKAIEDVLSVSKETH